MSNNVYKQFLIWLLINVGTLPFVMAFDGVPGVFLGLLWFASMLFMFAATGSAIKNNRDWL